MLSHWPIRRKLALGLGLLLSTVLGLFVSALHGLYSYRELVRSLSARSAELPLASDVQQAVSDLRVTLRQAKERLVFPYSVEPSPDPSIDETSGAAPSTEASGEKIVDVQGAWEASLLGGRFRTQLDQLVDVLDRYRRQLAESQLEAASRLADDAPERATLVRIDRAVAELRHKPLSALLTQDWLSDNAEIDHLLDHVEELHALSAELPSHLYQRLHLLANEVRARYRTGIFVAWVTFCGAMVLLVASNRVFYRWFADPLNRLVEETRQAVRCGFRHRIQLDARDELGELAAAMNDMTEKFCRIRDDLDQQVRERTSQVVRSEQLASVGFLAAGVSHEINNPLASIAMCSESLEVRLGELLEDAAPQRAEDVKVARHYLQMIQREAFRCKQITDKLLDFARRGDAQRHPDDLRELVVGVVDMVQHLGQYQDRSIDVQPGPPVIAPINSQEIKQVVLNLVTNALDSLDAGGTVRVCVDRQGDRARILVEDDGCGMTEEVQRHLFEPFFTRRRSGQGTGLGLSISHRIVEEHRGRIEARSDGPGRGSRFTVTLPATPTTTSPTPPRPAEAPLSKESSHRRQAA